ncbi:hypothetical protein F0562_004087 [Nyssa sinensis]|uniref:HD-Zip IV C-terminal domain-containing protein n=1 Tax=Nyssa sinensis TaxID=561372 RepID=A0A5J5BXL0_9ASTE|nr:hypothetical protein F0562_004087 [Nyssa sinensis]
MVKDFCSILSVSGRQDLPHLSELYNSGIRVTVRKSDGPGQPSGMVVSSATSVWLPLSCENLFNFFRDEKMRAQWDVLSNYNPGPYVSKLQLLFVKQPIKSNASMVSIEQPFIPTESNMLMLQESCVDPLGSLVVYAPIDATAIKSAIIGEDSTNVPILPSGFMISSDGRPDKGTKATGRQKEQQGWRFSSHSGFPDTGWQPLIVKASENGISGNCQYSCLLQPFRK